MPVIVSVIALAWIDRLSPAQALILFLGVVALWLAGLVYAVLYVKPVAPKRQRLHPPEMWEPYSPRRGSERKELI